MERKNTKKRGINIAVDEETHRLLKMEAAWRGMSLRKLLATLAVKESHEKV